MRLDIYKDETLAATFVYGAAPNFYGPNGQQIAELIAANAVVHNLWTQETDIAPLPDRVDWWAARIISAPLARAGFRLRITECGLRLDAAAIVQQYVHLPVVAPHDPKARAVR